jgi:hypothetical protein
MHGTHRLGAHQHSQHQQTESCVRPEMCAHTLVSLLQEQGCTTRYVTTHMIGVSPK